MALFLAKIVSAMEIETAVRSRLPLLIFIINNNGIYFGLDSAAYNKTSPLPSTALSPDTRYEMMAEVRSLLEDFNIKACGGLGFLVNTPAQLRQATVKALSETCPVIVNVIIDPSTPKTLVVLLNSCLTF